MACSRGGPNNFSFCFLFFILFLGIVDNGTVWGVPVTGAMLTPLTRQEEHRFEALVFSAIFLGGSASEDQAHLLLKHQV
jgi:hypothetical protein